MHISEIVPVRDENGAPRALFAGMNGSGKTTLMLKVIVEIRKEPGNFMVILDTDHMWNYQPMRKWKYEPDVPILIRKPSDLKSFDSGCFIYRPSHPAMQDPGVGAIFRWAMEYKNVDIVVDEVNDFHKNGVPEEEFGRCIKQGRKQQVRLIMGAQRTHNLPLICITESRYFYVFHLTNIRDRERLRDEVHPVLIIPADLEHHDFWVMKKGLKVPIYINGMPGDRTPLEFKEYMQSVSTRS